MGILIKLRQLNSPCPVHQQDCLPHSYTPLIFHPFQSFRSIGEYHIPEAITNKRIRSKKGSRAPGIQQDQTIEFGHYELVFNYCY